MASSDIQQQIGYTNTTLLSEGIWFCSTVPSASSFSTIDFFGIFASGDFAEVEYGGSGSQHFFLESLNGNGSNIAYTPGTCGTGTGWVWLVVTLAASGGTDYIAEYQCPSGIAPSSAGQCGGAVVQVGSNSTHTSAPGWTYGQHTLIGSDTATAPTTGYNVYVASQKICWDGTNPCLP